MHNIVAIRLLALQLVNLDVNKAIGVDKIGSKLPFSTAPGTSHSITLLFNASLESGAISVEWEKKPLLHLC